jgi:hypothetical protein
MWIVRCCVGYNSFADVEEAHDLNGGLRNEQSHPYASCFLSNVYLCRYLKVQAGRLVLLLNR